MKATALNDGQFFLKNRIFQCVFSLIILSTAISCDQQPAESEVGATLNQKSDISLDKLPKGVVDSVLAARPYLKISGAEKEIKNGIVYFDVAGTDEGGTEIELDLMEKDGQWQIMEVQRDIKIDELPAPVHAVLFEKVPEIQPARIIESDQGNGIIIFEVFTQSADGKESKYEIKLENDLAELLSEEWQH